MPPRAGPESSLLTPHSDDLRPASVRATFEAGERMPRGRSYAMLEA
jgi:hypothetical protein